MFHHIDTSHENSKGKEVLFPSLCVPLSPEPTGPLQDSTGNPQEDQMAHEEIVALKKRLCNFLKLT